MVTVTAWGIRGNKTSSTIPVIIANRSEGFVAGSISGSRIWTLLALAVLLALFAPGRPSGVSHLFVVREHHKAVSREHAVASSEGATQARLMITDLGPGQALAINDSGLVHGVPATGVLVASPWQ